MKMPQRLFVILMVLLSCFGCDQITKRIAKSSLETSPPRVYLGDTFRLQYAENTGAFLSLGSNLPKGTRTLLFTTLSGLLLIGLLAYIVWSKGLTRSHVFALSLILGGGFSNLADRIYNDGKVIDFMNMGIGGLRTGIFNIADVVIMVGMGLILLYNFKMRKGRDSGATADDDAPEEVPGA